jgi:hypothetical protein
MKKSYHKLSVIVSAVLGALFLVAIAVACYWLPLVVNSLIDVKDNVGNRANITESGRAFVLWDAYAMVAVAVVAVLLLFFLLRVVYQHRTFSEVSSRLISAVSWCCFLEVALSLLLIYFFQLVICFALAAGFLGLCLRIVKHVVEEATRLKNENDFTI